MACASREMRSLYNLEPPPGRIAGRVAQCEIVWPLLQRRDKWRNTAHVMVEDSRPLAIGRGHHAAGIQALDRGLAVLDVIAEADRALTVGEIAERLGLTTPTVSRLAATLRNRGLLAQEGRSGPYALGLELARFAHRALSAHPLEVAAAPVMERLVRELGETVSLAVPTDHGVLYVRSQGPDDRVLHVSIPVGKVLPYSATATGKVLLAYGDPMRVERVVEAGLVARTPRTITDPDRFREAIAHVAREGFAVDRGESDANVGCVAVPVFRDGSLATAALSCSAVLPVITDTRAQEMRTSLAAAAEQISEAYGWGQPVRRRMPRT
ncbi:MAG: helix-turn-helix domain-containing protein [Dehalococcoidia bacterium]|nr:helix-turn-helix domain-containing protein [Dehalococcoidia bacterium]